MSISFKTSLIGNGLRLSSVTSDRVPRKYERRSIVTTALQNDEEEANSSRRNFLSGLILAVGASGVLVQGARASYYSDLLETSKKPDTTQLLKAYEKTKESESKTKKSKSVKSKVTSKRLPATKQGNTDFGATGSVVGGLGVVGAAVLGLSSSKKKEAIKPPSRPKTAVKKPAIQPPQVRKSRLVAASQGTMKKPASKPLNSGTVRLPPKSTGTIAKSAKKGSGTQKVGKVEKSEKQSILGPAVGLGLVTIFAAYFLASPNTAPVQEQRVVPKEEISQSTNTVVETPKVEPAPVQKEMNEVTSSTAQQPPVVSSEVQSSDSGISKSKLPPTTGNSPIVLVGGSIVALVVAAAVGAPPSQKESATATVETSSEGSGTPESRAAEARAWIEAWKSRQKDTPESRAADAKAWIEAWKNKQK